MEEETYEYHFSAEVFAEGEAPQPPRPPRRTVSLRLMVVVTSVLVLAAVLITSVVSTLFAHLHYASALMEQEEMIQRLKEEGKRCDLDVQHLEALATVFEKYSYYYGSVDNKEIMTALLREYTALTGDRYAAYYTDEEYREMASSNAGNHVGIGIGIVSTKVTLSNVEHSALQVTEVYPEGPSADVGLLPGDYIYGYFKDDVLCTVTEVGFDQALADLRGEAGTEARIAVYRKVGDGYETLQFSVLRRTYVASSVSSFISETDPTVAVLRIRQFDLQTPIGLKREILACQAQGAQRFVFDVRNNPGGDLQSVKASLTYFLQEGDLVMKTIDREGTVQHTYVAEEMQLRGSYATCSVAKDEIGMFSDLEMVVLCNGSSASAAEVFTAALRDHGLATVVGETTFGKGIMQTVLDLSSFGGGEGFFKLTTYAYVTECGVSYHEKGIEPSIQASLSEEAKQIYPTLLPEAKDDQLLAAIGAFW